MSSSPSRGVYIKFVPLYLSLQEECKLHSNYKYITIISHSRIASFADNHTRLVHWVNIVFEAKVRCHTVSKHPMVGVPWWKLQWFCVCMVRDIVVEHLLKLQKDDPCRGKEGGREGRERREGREGREKGEKEERERGGREGRVKRERRKKGGKK